MKWTVTRDDQKLSEIVDKALHEERQQVHTDEGVVVVISKAELDQIERRKRSFGEHLLSIPKGDVEFPRDRDLPREFEW